MVDLIQVREGEERDPDHLGTDIRAATNTNIPKGIEDSQYNLNNIQISSP